jgi:hypothetical protein
VKGARSRMHKHKYSSSSAGRSARLRRHIISSVRLCAMPSLIRPLIAYLTVALFLLFFFLSGSVYSPNGAIIGSATGANFDVPDSTRRRSLPSLPHSTEYALSWIAFPDFSHYYDIQTLSPQEFPSGMSSVYESAGET